MTFVYAYIQLPERPWRIYEALCLRGPDESGGRIAQLVIVDGGSIHIESIEHLSGRTSASAWVYQHEFTCLAIDVLKDWEKRGFWKEAKEDVDRISTELGLMLPGERVRMAALVRACKPFREVTFPAPPLPTIRVEAEPFRQLEKLILQL